MTQGYFDTGLFRMGLFWFGVILAWGYFGLGLFRFGVILVWGYYGLGLFWWGYFSGVISVWGYFILEPFSKHTYISNSNKKVRDFFFKVNF